MKKSARIKSLLRCKACGFLIEEKKLGDVCPACGVPRTAFAPYSDTMSEKRRKRLNLHLHQIAAHFPQALPVFSLMLVLLVFVTENETRSKLLAAIRIISLFIPLFAAAALLTGMFDGKTRFKKLKTPHLMKKIIAASIFISLSAVAAVLILLQDIENVLIYVLVLNAACVLCAVFLGKTGSTLVGAELAG